MEIIHIAAECYPYAKAGGLGDVVGALPKYQQQLGHIAKVILPMYRTPYLYNHTWDTVHQGYINIGAWRTAYTVIKESSGELGFDLYCVDINGLLDREKIYGYTDDTERFIGFQIAAVDWLSQWQHKPNVVHVHDHHAGLVPFLMQHCYQYKHLSNIKTILTIHNAQYQGAMPWSKVNLLPSWDSWAWGKLDWNNAINPLASAVKCAHKVNTVSPSYMQEIRYNANGLEKLFEYEQGKCSGIINGIDTKVWNTANDSYLQHHYTSATVVAGKAANKALLCTQFNLQQHAPLCIFIGRLVGEKAADILPQTIRKAMEVYDGKINFLILGSGDPAIEQELTQLTQYYTGYYNSRIAYNEALSHTMYAGADYILMPSRVEPCGLNQLYALRYGTIPLVRNTGGLKDTVIDVGDGGYGFTFNEATVSDVIHTLGRAAELYYYNKPELERIQQYIMQLNYSWEHSAALYINLYKS